MAIKSAIAATFAAVLVAGGGVCGVAHADYCFTELNGNANWCPSTGLVNNLSDDYVIGLIPVGFTSAPTPNGRGPTLAGWAISGLVHDGALLVPPGGSAYIWGPTDVYYDGWATVALQAGTALCNGTKLCKSVLNTFTDFNECVLGAADALDDAATGVWPGESEIVAYVQTAGACRSAVDDLKKMQPVPENRPVPEEARRSLATDVLMQELPKNAGLKPINSAKFNLFEFGKVLLKGMPR
jgi:hypothetical protein